MKSFSHRTRVRASISRVAAFHHDTRVLKQLSPPPVIVQLHEFEPLAENSRADFTLWLGPFPVRWVALHSAVEPLRGFTDTQIAGPFKSWVHRHSFEKIDEYTTDVVDEIQAEPGGFVSHFMWLNLPFMFAYRGWVTRRVCEKEQKA